VSNTYLVARFVFHCLSSQCLCLLLHASLSYQCWLRVRIVVEGILSRQACSALAYLMRFVSGICLFLEKKIKISISEVRW
jgi:hypothetical protein